MKDLFETELPIEEEKLTSSFSALPFFSDRLPSSLLEEKKAVTEELNALNAKQNFWNFVANISFAMLALGLLFSLISVYQYAVNKMYSLPFIIIGIVLLFLSILLLFIGKRRVSSIFDSKEAKLLIENDGKITAAIEDLHPLPDDYQEIDILIHVHERENKESGYVSVNATVFKDDKQLCIYLYDFLFKIPFSDITDIKETENRITFRGWNKKGRPSDAFYKPYKMKITEGVTIETAAYRLLLSYQEETYTILIPNYEEGAIMTLIKPNMAERK